MDFSKWKLEVYDLLAIILPGMIAICEGWVLFRGWDQFCSGAGQLTAAGLTLLLLASFGSGTLIQELGDFALKAVKGERFFRSGRDKYWSTKRSDPLKIAIRIHLGLPISSVDSAFDFCLTQLKGQFPKRDLFVATSDLSRSFVVLAALALAPLLRSEYRNFGWGSNFMVWSLASVLTTAVIFRLSWRRMIRFRELSDTTVFGAYLATLGNSIETRQNPNNSAENKAA